MKSICSLIIAVLVLASCSGKQPVSINEQEADKAPEKTDKYIGLQLYSLRDDIKVNFDSTITAVGAMGYKFVEAAGYNEGKLYDLTPEEYKAKVEAAGLTSLSTHVGRALDFKKLNWDETWAWWDQCIDAHVKAGCKYIVMPWMPELENKDQLKQYCDYFNKIGERCKAKGIKFGYHNHDFEFKELDGVTIYDYMLENTDPALVLFEMDVYWVVRGGKSPVEYFKKYPGRFELLHIKDDKELGQSGMVGFEPIFNNLGSAGTKYLVVEVEKYDHTPKESVKLSLDYLLNAPFVKADYSK